MKRTLTGSEKANATKKARFADELVRRDVVAASVPLPKAWAAALRVPCPRAGCEAKRREPCARRHRQRAGGPHADRVRAAKQAKERAQARRELES